ncbi:cytochrome c [Roseovarius nanhaiticus]|uniref:Cytochrome c n=1 Tax=Roseovarius nanhaiticus TaxID=573024 RepID=A0A1N7HN42_9RHOB|nr:cytochrome C-552 [Roseovarius nanhaiticus]SEL36313.1 cytochrome c [Roseovarius nanhaiticus]SIS26269.1 cytochrome c [Roseovarius nanhaiticus]
MTYTTATPRAALLALGLCAASAAQAYDPMAPAANPLTPAAPPAAPQAEARQTAAPDPELGMLPKGDGAEATYYQCIACHSTAIIRQQHLTDARWDYLWTWMVEDQGMSEPDEETKEQILSYLKKHFSSER